MDYNDNYQYSNNNKSFDLKKVIIVICFLVILIIGFIIYNNYQNSYNYLESKLESEALKYVRENNLESNTSFYLDVNKLNIKLKDNCYSISGVLVENNEYKPYLICDDYETKLNNTENKYIKLNGRELLFLNKGDEYAEPYYETIVPVDVNINSNVGVLEGIYNVNYVIKKDNSIVDSITRKVIVLDNNEINNFEPNITLNGDEIEYIEFNTNYVDKGVKAFDSLDGVIDNIKINGQVNTSLEGEYKLTYTVINSRGFAKSVTRKVIVLSGEKKEFVIDYMASPTSLTNDKVKITLAIYSDDYSYTLLPNGETTEEKVIRFEVKENGIYGFEVYDIHGNKNIKEIEINNIDNIPPVGTCEAILNFSMTEVTVDATDDIGISGYSYILDDKKSEYITFNSYKLDKPANKVSVNIKDNVGNESTILCQITDRKNSTNPAGITKIISSKPKLTIPIDQALAKRGYTINDLNQCISKRVEEAGPGTRYGVVAAAYGLLDCMLNMTGTVLSYDHTGGKVHIDPDTNYCSFNSDICGKIGINTKWGKSGGTCPNGGCHYGLNCATFVRWSLCNGGMNLCIGGTAGASSMVNVKYFKEADGVIVNGNSVKYYSGNNLTNHSAYELVRMVKPGDLGFRERNNDIDGSSQHAFVIVGKDETGIYTANNGSYIEKITYSSMLKGEYYYRILFLDNYYANENNRNNLYK